MLANIYTSEILVTCNLAPHANKDSSWLFFSPQSINRIENNQLSMKDALEMIFVV